jgi:hypothetical protein
LAKPLRAEPSLAGEDRSDRHARPAAARVLHDIKRDPPDFLYRLIGTEVRRHMSEDRTGQWMSTIPGQKPPSQIWNNLLNIVAAGRPILNHTPYVGPHRDFVRMESVQLPLAADGVNVNMILVFVDFLRV